MTMLDRRSRTGPQAVSRSERRAARKAERKAERKAGRTGAGTSGRTAPPPSSGPDEETVRIARKDFRRRRRAGRWRRARALVVAVLVLAVLAASVWLVYFSSYVTVRAVDVTGTQGLGEHKVERAAEVPTGAPLARVDLDAVRARVESIASVRRAEVSRSWPHTVHIAVTERTPLAVVDRGDGLQALDDEGVLFGHYGTRPRRLPLVRTEPDTRTEVRESARVIEALPAHVAARVDVVEVASVDEITLDLHNGRKVVWGSAEDSDQKAEVLAVLLKRPANQIDVSVPGRPTTR
jgi:cell division protein FtsQ